MTKTFWEMRFCTLDRGNGGRPVGGRLLGGSGALAKSRFNCIAAAAMDLRRFAAIDCLREGEDFCSMLARLAGDMLDRLATSAAFFCCTFFCCSRALDLSGGRVRRFMFLIPTYVERGSAKGVHRGSKQDEFIVQDTPISSCIDATSKARSSSSMPKKSKSLSSKNVRSSAVIPSCRQALVGSGQCTHARAPHA